MVTQLLNQANKDNIVIASNHPAAAHLDARESNGTKQESSDASQHTGWCVGKESSNLQAQHHMSILCYHASVT